MMTRAERFCNILEWGREVNYIGTTAFEFTVVLACVGPENTVTNSIFV